MYLKHWGLRRRPFDHGRSPSLYYPTETGEEALARLRYLTAQPNAVGLLLGDSGSGKSLLLESLAAELRRSGQQVFKANLLGLGTQEFFWLAAADLGLNPSQSATAFELGLAIADRLAVNRWQRLQTVFLLDDADEAGSEVLAQVTRLLQYDATGQSRACLVLATRGDRVANLGRRLLDLVDLRIEIEPWRPDETAAYIRQALARAGRTHGTFTADALARLHEVAAGAPRRVQTLADLALLAAAADQLPLVDAQTVENVYLELALPECSGIVGAGH